MCFWYSMYIGPTQILKPHRLLTLPQWPSLSLCRSADNHHYRVDITKIWSANVVGYLMLLQRSDKYSALQQIVTNLGLTKKYCNSLKQHWAMLWNQISITRVISRPRGAAAFCAFNANKKVSTVRPRFKLRCKCALNLDFWVPMRPLKSYGRSIRPASGGYAKFRGKLNWIFIVGD